VNAEQRVVEAALRFQETHDLVRDLTAQIKDLRRCERFTDGSWDEDGGQTVKPVPACWLVKEEEYYSDPEERYGPSAPAWAHDRYKNESGEFFVRECGYCVECGRTVDMLRQRRELQAKKGARVQALKRCARTVRQIRATVAALPGGSP